MEFQQLCPALSGWTASLQTPSLPEVKERQPVTLGPGCVAEQEALLHPDFEECARSVVLKS